MFNLVNLNNSLFFFFIFSVFSWISYPKCLGFWHFGHEWKTWYIFHSLEQKSNPRVFERLGFESNRVSSRTYGRWWRQRNDDTRTIFVFEHDSNIDHSAGSFHGIPNRNIDSVGYGRCHKCHCVHWNELPKIWSAFSVSSCERIFAHCSERIDFWSSVSR